MKRHQPDHENGRGGTSVAVGILSGTRFAKFIKAYFKAEILILLEQLKAISSAHQGSRPTSRICHILFKAKEAQLRQFGEFGFKGHLPKEGREQKHHRPVASCRRNSVKVALRFSCVTRERVFVEVSPQSAQVGQKCLQNAS